MKSLPQRKLKVAGLFAGIGGIELGLERAGHETELLCEIDPYAREVLRTQFPGRQVHDDVRTLDTLPEVDLLSAGFPCQDLSLAGTQRGLEGERSGLVSEVFRLIRANPPEFVLLENVLYLVKRQRGALITMITSELEQLGYRWAYRVVDSRGFGLPQRRQRVIILASRGSVDPADVLFRLSAEPLVDDRIDEIDPGVWYGFYWTEGKRAVGWARDAVPTIKGGSGLGIPSPPAIFDSNSDTVGTPTIDDGERLQGFPAAWTDVKLDGDRLKVGRRWTLVGNAVSVPVAQWVGEELALGEAGIELEPVQHSPGRPMPFAAAGMPQGFRAVRSSLHVRQPAHEPIRDFLSEPLVPLSPRAIRGFLRRTRMGVMRLPPEFLAALEQQLATSSDQRTNESTGL